jgi:hypothetical protein
MGKKMTIRRRKTHKKSHKQYLRKSNKRSSKNKRKTYKNKIIGGQRYGTGVGSNCYDPNLSIFNTNLLKLFPYKPT